MDTWVGPSLGGNEACEPPHMSFHRRMCSCLLGKHVAVELLGPLVSMKGVRKSCQTVFPSGVSHPPGLYSLWSRTAGSPHPHRCLRCLRLRLRVPRDLLVVLICSSLRPQLWSILSFANRPFTHLSWWRVCSPFCPFQMGPSPFPLLSYNVPFSLLEVSVFFCRHFVPICGLTVPFS